MSLSIKEIEKRVSDSYELPNSVLDTIPKPVVTVRTSTYQHAPYIRECIEGVLMQKTTFQVEYIIGEDFSTDGTREIVFEYAEKYPDKIRVITADYNVGGKSNAIRCIKGSNGKYMAICEGDDCWIDPLKLQRQVDFLEANPDYGLVFTDADVFFERNGKTIPSYNKTFKRKMPTGNIFEYFLYGNAFRTCTALFKKNCYEDLVYPFLVEQNYPMGDLILWLHISAKQKVGYLDCSTSVYRMLEKSASHFSRIDDFDEFLSNSKKIREEFAKYYNVKINRKKIQRRNVRSVITKIIFDEKYGRLKRYYNYPFLIFLIFLKEKFKKNVQRLDL